MSRIVNLVTLCLLIVLAVGSCSDLPLGPDTGPSAGVSDMNPAPPRQVRIDIQPSTISLAPNGSTAANVILFSTSGFDASQVGPESVRLVVAHQGGGARVGTRGGVYQTTLRDYDGDGRNDRLLTFTISDLRLAGLGGCHPPLSLTGRIGEEQFVGADPTPPAIAGGTTVAAIQVLPDSARVIVGGSQQLTVRASGPQGEVFYCGASWSSSDTTRATVDSGGLITARAVGEPVTITATEAGLTSTAVVHVVRTTQPVPATTPESFPDDLYNNPANVLENSPYFALSNAVLKDVVSLRFQEGATQAERQAAIDLVGGDVIGGQPFDDMEGYYLVRVQDGGAGVQLRQAIDTLNTLPQVGIAEPEYLHWPGDWLTYLRPQDSEGWRQWQLNPASADGGNWALEAISAPMAWGCSTGTESTRVAVMDVGFRSFSDLTPNINVPQAERYLDLYEGFQFANNDHGTRVSSVIAARGNNGTGITGVMWRAQMNLYDTSVELNGQSNVAPAGVIWKAPLPVIKMIGYQLKRSIDSGARVVNISEGVIGLWGHPAPEDYKFREIKARADEYARIVRNATNKPLIVIAAGNHPVDAFWSVLPYLARLVPDQVLVVGGVQAVTTTHAILDPASALNENSAKFESDLVQIAAPSRDVGVIGEGWLLNESVAANNGTSFAAPLVAGVAGLLFSFDPTLTAPLVKSFLIRGAERAGRMVYGLPPAHLLDAYESLKLAAAERPKGPLCGNRVWASNGQVVAQRGTGADTLFRVNEPVWEVNVLHGGRDIRIMHPRSYRSFRYQPGPNGGTWAEVPDTSTLDWPEGTGGATYSYSAYSHDGDKRVRERTSTSGDQLLARLSLVDTRTRVETPLATIGLPNESPPRTGFCMLEFLDLPPEGLPSEWEPEYEEWRKWLKEGLYRMRSDSTCHFFGSYTPVVRGVSVGLGNGAYSPTGETYLYVANYQAHREQIVSNSCISRERLYRTREGQTDSIEVPVRYTCRDLRQQDEDAGAEVYEVPLPGGQGWKMRPDLSEMTANLWGLRISEDGKEWSATRVTSRQDHTDGFRWNPELREWENFRRVNSFERQCVTRFRSVETGAVREEISACENLDDFTHTFSPSLLPGSRPGSPGGLAPATPQRRRPAAPIRKPGSRRAPS